MSHKTNREQLPRYIAELEASEQYFRTLFETTTDAVLLLDPQSGVFDCNPAAVVMFGAGSKEELCALKATDLSAPRQAGDVPSEQQAIQHIAEAFEQGQLCFEWWAKRRDGQIFTAHVTLVAITVHDGPMLQCIVRDISILKQRELEAYQASKALERANHELQVAMEQLQFVATTDQLTATWNRRFFNRVIHTERARAARSGNPLVLILVDIDHFKRINDQHGHLVGDEVLVEVASTLQEELRVTDYLIRWGGEEFAILAPDLDEAEGKALAERLRQEIARRRFPEGIRVTISAGVAQLHDDDVVTKWVTRADNALYSAKHAGRNQVVVGRVA